MVRRVALRLAVPVFTVTLLMAQAKPTRVRMSSRVLAGQLTKKVDPVYPAAALADHITGVVVMQVLVDGEGKVEDATVVSGPNSLRDASVTAVRQWTYRPYLINGNPVEVQSTVTINFHQ